MIKLTRIDGALLNLSGLGKTMFTVLIILLVLNILTLALAGVLMWSMKITELETSAKLKSLETQIASVNTRMDGMPAEIKKVIGQGVKVGRINIAKETMESVQKLLKNSTDLYKELGK